MSSPSEYSLNLSSLGHQWFNCSSLAIHDAYHQYNTRAYFTLARKPNNVDESIKLAELSDEVSRMRQEIDTFDERRYINGGAFGLAGAVGGWAVGNVMRKILTGKTFPDNVRRLTRLARIMFVPFFVYTGVSFATVHTANSVFVQNPKSLMGSMIRDKLEKDCPEHPQLTLFRMKQFASGSLAPHTPK